MNTYKKPTINDKIIFENDIVHFKIDDDIDYKLGKVVFDDEAWKIVDIKAKKAMEIDVAYMYYGLIIYKE